MEGELTPSGGQFSFLHPVSHIKRLSLLQAVWPRLGVRMWLWALAQTAEDHGPGLQPEVSIAADGPQRCPGWLLRRGAGPPAWVGLEKVHLHLKGPHLGWRKGRTQHYWSERERERQARGWGAGVERPLCGLWASGAEWPQCLEVWGSLPTSHSPSSDLVSPHLDFLIYCFFHCCFHLRVTFFTFLFFKFFIGIYLIDIVLKWNRLFFRFFSHIGCYRILNNPQSIFKFCHLCNDSYFFVV